MPDEAVLDAPVETEVVAIESPESTEPVVETVPAEGTPEAQIDTKQPLLKQAKSVIENIQKENPALASKLKDALAQYDRYKPNELKEATALKGEVVSLAQALNDPEYQGAEPAQILADVKSQLGYFHGLDGMFTSASPDFVNKLAEASPDSFQKLAPTIFQKFSEMNPDGYSSYVSQAVLGHMQQHDVPMQFKIAKFLLSKYTETPELKEIKDALGKIEGWTDELKSFSSKPITAAAKKADEPADIEAQRQELATRELDVTRQSWNSSATRFGNDLIGKEMTRLSGKTQLTDEQKGQIVSKVAEELDARMQGNRPYGEAMRAFLKNKDQQGYTRRLHSEYQKLIPGAVSRAYSDVTTAAKAAPKVAAKAATSVAAPAKGNDGYIPISKYPVGQVDMLKTSGKDHAEGRLTLKNGSKRFFNRKQA